MSDGRASWIKCRLADTASFVMGQAPPGTECNKEGRGTVFVKAGEFGALRPVVREWTTKPLKMAARGDVLICVVGATAGKLNLGIDAAIGRSVAAIRPIGSTLPEFLYHQLMLQVGQLRKDSAGTAQGVISSKDLAEIQIVLAPPLEQRRVVEAIEAHFTQLDAAVAALERVRANLKRYRACVLHAAFEGEWPIEELDRLVAEGRPICYGILKPQMHGQGAIPYVEVKDLKDHAIAVPNLHKTSTALHQEFARSTLRAGDVLVAVRGSWGRSGIVPPDLEGGNISRDVARISPSQALDARFLRHFLVSWQAQAFLTKHARGVAVKGVNIGDLRKLPIPRPSVEEQRQIVTEIESRLSVADALAREVDAGLKRCARLRQAILKKAFEGRLVPQTTMDDPPGALLRAPAPAAGRKPRRAA